MDFCQKYEILKFLSYQERKPEDYLPVESC